MKHALKVLIRRFVANMKATLIFPGEHSVQGLQPFVTEFFQRQSKGILHIGGSTGQEAEDYHRMRLPVIWIEADPDIFSDLVIHLRNFPEQKAFNFLISDSEREMEFFVTDNYGLSSSVYPLSALGKTLWNIKNVNSKRIFSKRLDHLSDVNFSDYDFWVVDVQGHELEVLKGGETVLGYANWILVEVSTTEFYETQSLFPEIHAWITSRGFHLIYRLDSFHGEVLYGRIQDIS
jgi:FkbM family methyltransferase